MMKSFIVGFLCLSVIACERTRYDNYRVYSVDVRNAQQLSTLNSIGGEITFMEVPTTVGRVAEIVVPPHKFAYIGELFETLDMKHQLITDNLQKLIDGERGQNKFSSSFGWTGYNDLEAIYAWLDGLVKRFPTALTNIEYGLSYEGRPLRAIKVSHNNNTKPSIFIESTAHPNDWIATATATYFLNELVTSKDDRIRALADNYDWIIVPVMNVDGYEYTHSTNRLWRKTRRPITPTCKGVDLTRNFDFNHAASQTADQLDPCYEEYAGPGPFSEPESLHLSRLIQSENVQRLGLYLAFHSYNQLLLFPYGHSQTTKVPNYDDLLQIGNITVQAIKQRYGTSYSVGSISDEFGSLVPGTSIDWVYQTQNVKLTYFFVFRDRGEHAFLLPPDQIIPNSEEVIDGIVAMLSEAKKLKYL